MAKSNGKAALSLDELRKRLREAQGSRTSLENKRTSAITERDRLDANYIKLLREGGDLERAYARKKVANDLVGDLAAQIAEAEARVTSIQFQINAIEAVEQTERDFVRRQEIAARRGDSGWATNAFVKVGTKAH